MNSLVIILLTIFVLPRFEFMGTSIGFVLMFGYALIEYILNQIYSKYPKKNFTKNDLLYPLFILAFIYNIPFFYNSFEFSSIKKFLFPLFLWFYLVGKDGKYLKQLFSEKNIIFVICVIGGILIYDFIQMFSLNEGIKKIYSFANPNYTGFLLLSIQAFYLTVNKNKQSKFLLVITTVLIFLTFSKTAYVLQIITIMWILKKQKIVLMLAIFIPVLILILTTGKLLDNFYLQIIDFLSHDLQAGINSREKIINIALSIFQNNLFFGCGYGNIVPESVKLGGKAYETHNIILTSLAECGLFGFLSLMICSVVILLKIKVIYKINSNVILIFLIYFLYALTHAGGESLIFVPLIFKTLSTNLYEGYD